MTGAWQRSLQVVDLHHGLGVGQGGCVGQVGELWVVWKQE